MIEHKERLSTRTRALAGVLLFLGLFWVYLRSSPADLYLDDSGETVTVAVTLGIGHPPGYPLHSLTARLFSLPPWGSAVWRLNALAAFMGALAAALLAWVASARSLLAAIIVAILMALGPVYWHNALGAKGSIYQLNNLLSVGLLILAQRQSVRLFWLGLGLALAHHYMSQLPLLPAYAWLLWRPNWKTSLRPAWLLLPGLALYAYLPLRWRLQPELAWGSFATWDEFWFFFFRLQYAAAELSRSVQGSLVQGWHALGLLLREGSGVLSALALAGLWQGRRERLNQALALGMLGTLAAVTLYLNLKPERLDLMRPYLFPAYLCQAWLAALALTHLFERAGAPWDKSLASLGLTAALVWGAIQWPQQSLRHYHYASDNAQSILLALPKNALLLAQGDAVIFPLWYHQRVLKQRLDVAVVGLAVLPMAWVRQDLARKHPDLTHPRVPKPVGAESVGRLTDAYLRLNSHRPLYAAFNRFEPPLAGWHLRSEGLVWRVLPDARPEDRAAAARHLQAGRLRGFTQRPMDARTLRLIVADRAISWNSLGVSAEEAKALPQALDYYRQAAKLHPENPDFAFNQGNALHALGRLGEAEFAYRSSVARDARYVNGWYNLAVTLYQTGRRPEAKECFKRVLELDGGRTDVQQLLQQMGP